MINKHLPGVHNQKLHGVIRGYRPNPIGVSSKLREKYNSNPNMKNPNFIMNDGFSASISYQGINYSTNIFSVSDPAVAEDYIDNVVALAKQHDFATVSFTGLPVDKAIQLNGFYLLDNNGLKTLVTGAFNYLRSKYDIALPKPFNTPDWPLAWLVINLPNLQYNPNSTYGYRVPVAEIHKIKHPLQPDVPLFDEYVYEERAGKEIIVEL